VCRPPIQEIAVGLPVTAHGVRLLRELPTCERLWNERALRIIAMEELTLNYWRKAFSNLSVAFNAAKIELCQLDGAIGDGDHGASMARGFEETERELSSLGELPDVATLFRTAGNAFLSKVGGVTGVIFGTFFLEAGKKAEGLTQLDAPALSVMFDSALAGVKKKGKVSEGDKSMVDALAPAVAALKQMSEKAADCRAVLSTLAEAARRGSEATKAMAAKVGRARYQKQKGVGHVDPGSASIAIFFRTLLENSEATRTAKS
jgi:phosphoenolpyruvate---glycerone phosphotransferase subunit DhaL